METIPFISAIIPVYQAEDYSDMNTYFLVNLVWRQSTGSRYLFRIMYAYLTITRMLLIPFLRY